VGICGRDRAPRIPADRATEDAADWTMLVEDSANDVGTGVQKARKLIDRDQVSFIIGDVNSGIAIAIAQPDE
jgi:hypothetical protein